MSKRYIIAGKIIVYLLLNFSFSKAQYNSIEWTSYLTDKNVKMVDSELVEYAVATTEGAQDYIYITGQTHSTTSQNTFCNTNLGNGDCFLAKYTTKGKMQWIRYFGGPGTDGDSLLHTHYDWAYCLAVDKSPNNKPRIYVGGTTVKSRALISCSQSSCTEDVYQAQPADDWDGFIAKFDGNGNLLRWTYVGGGEPGATDTDEVLTLAVQNHQVYAGGYTESHQNSLLQKSKLISEYDTTYNGGGDGFIAVFDTCLSSLRFFSYYNTNADLSDTLNDPAGQDRVHCIKVGEDGEVYVTGTAKSATGISRNSLNSFAGISDAFVGKWTLDSIGNLTPAWCRYLGGDQLERGRQLALDDEGNIYCDGITRSDSSTFHATQNALQKNSGGDADGFVAKLDEDGNLKWLTYLGGLHQDLVNGIQVVKSADKNYVAVAGLTLNCDFFSSKNYCCSVLNVLNGDTTCACPNYDSLSLKRDAFVIMLTDPDDNSDSIMQVYSGSFLGGSKNETSGPSETFTGYGPYLTFSSKEDMYVTFSTTSRDVGDVNHGHSKTLKNKFHGKTDAILMKLPYSNPIQKYFSETLSETLESTHTMEIFPQPCSSFATLILHNEELENGEIRICNALGECVSVILRSANDPKIISLDLRRLDSGVYFVQYNSASVHDVIKLIKE